MRGRFDIRGYFYKIGKHKCRKYLDIKSKGSKLSVPDLMVVMMNPGSSYPIDGNDDNDSVSEAVPDNTQDQIMKVMEHCDYKYARVLNLSDLRTPNSNQLYDFLRSPESKAIPHSIFSEERQNDFDSLYIKNAPVIYAWGVNETLTSLATVAVNKINHTSPVGLQKDGSNYLYYHPLPRSYKQQREWVFKIIQMLKCT